MTRTQRALKNSEARAQKTKRKVLNLVTGMFAEEYKKKSGKWNVSKRRRNNLMGKKESLQKRIDYIEGK